MGSESSDGLKNDLIKIIVDKLLIGLLIALAGLYANKIIEKYKADQSFRRELNVEQAQKIAEVWENVYLVESTLEDALEKLADLDEAIDERAQILRRSRDAGELSAEDLNKEMEALSVEMREDREEIWTPVREQEAALLNVLNRNRFWLGDERYARVREYQRLVTSLAASQQNAEIKKILEQMRKTLGGYISDVRENLLRKDKGDRDHPDAEP